jgi:hypothetical protein
MKLARTRGLAHLVGTLGLYAIHLACAGAVFPRTAAVANAAPIGSAKASSAPVVVASVAPSATGMPAPAPSASGELPTVTAGYVVAGDESVVLDKEDASASLEVAAGRNSQGKRVWIVSAVVRAFRTDVHAEKPTTLAVRATLLEGASAPSTPKDLDAYFTTWPGPGALAPHSYATVVKSGLAFSIAEGAVEVRGSLALKDVATGKTVRLEKIAIRRSGRGVLPPRAGVWLAP